MVLFIFPYVMASNISMSYPSSVVVGEEFNLTIHLLNFSEGIYDLKIEIKNGSKTIAKVYTDNVWTSTYYWIKNAFSGEESGTFRVMIHEPYEGVNNFTIKIRDATQTWIFEGNTLTIKNKNSEQRESEKKEEQTSYEMKWNKDSIINGNDFAIIVEGETLIVEGETLAGKDVRLWIEHEGIIISERYDEKNKQWKSGLFYVNDFEGNEMLLRIKEEERDFEGDATILLKIRNGYSYTDTIEILEKETVQNGEEKENRIVESNPKREVEKNTTKEHEEIIQLGTGKAIVESVSTRSLVYESKIERIKRYSLYGFAVLCVALCVLLAWRR